MRPVAGCASALPTAMLNVVRRSRLITSRGSPKFRSRLARSRSAGPPCSSYFSPGGVEVAWQPSSWWTRTGMCPVGESCLSYRLTASTGSPATSSNSTSATGGTAEQRLALEAGQGRAEAALRCGTQRGHVECADHPPQVAGRHRGIPAASVPAGPFPAGDHHDRTRAVPAERPQDAVCVHRADPRQGRHPRESRPLGQHVLEEVQTAHVAGTSRGADRQPDGEDRAAKPCHRSIPSARHSSWIRGISTATGVS
jgi:hypothetical protein